MRDDAGFSFLKSRGNVSDCVIARPRAGLIPRGSRAPFPSEAVPRSHSPSRAWPALTRAMCREHYCRHRRRERGRPERAVCVVCSELNGDRVSDWITIFCDLTFDFDSTFSFEFRREQESRNFFGGERYRHAAVRPTRGCETDTRLRDRHAAELRLRLFPSINFRRHLRSVRRECTSN